MGKGSKSIMNLLSDFLSHGFDLFPFGDITLVVCDVIWGKTSVLSYYYLQVGRTVLRLDRIYVKDDNCNTSDSQGVCEKLSNTRRPLKTPSVTCHNFQEDERTACDHYSLFIPITAGSTFEYRSMVAVNSRIISSEPL